MCFPVSTRLARPATAQAAAVPSSARKSERDTAAGAAVRGLVVRQLRGWSWGSGSLWEFVLGVNSLPSSRLPQVKPSSFFSGYQCLRLVHLGDCGMSSGACSKHFDKKLAQAASCGYSSWVLIPFCNNDLRYLRNCHLSSELSGDSAYCVDGSRPSHTLLLEDVRTTNHKQIMEQTSKHMNKPVIRRFPVL